MGQLDWTSLHHFDHKDGKNCYFHCVHVSQPREIKFSKTPKIDRFPFIVRSGEHFQRRTANRTRLRAEMIKCDSRYHVRKNNTKLILENLSRSYFSIFARYAAINQGCAVAANARPTESITKKAYLQEKSKRTESCNKDEFRKASPWIIVTARESLKFSVDSKGGLVRWMQYLNWNNGNAE